MNRTPSIASRAVVTQQQKASLDLKPQFRLQEVPQVRTDAVGAISMLSEEDLTVAEGVYENVDGRRYEDGRYKAFMDVSSPESCQSSTMSRPPRFRCSCTALQLRMPSNDMYCTPPTRVLPVPPASYPGPPIPS